MSVNGEQAKNNSVNEAVGTLKAAGHPVAAEQLATGAPNIPVGLATTVAGGINGHPRAATSLLGSVASELQSPEMNGMFKMAGLASLLQMMPMFAQMFSSIGGGISNAFTSSLNIASMSSVPGSPLSANFMKGLGAAGADMSLRSVDPASGSVGAYGATAPSINSPAAVAMQRNAPAVVPGMSGPSMSPPGMG